MKIRKGDNVLVTVGKDRGKQATIVKVMPKINKAVIDGLNLAKKHTKPSPRNPHGGVIEFSAPIAISNLRLVCSNCSKPTRIGRKITADGSIRVCKKCAGALDIKKSK